MRSIAASDPKETRAGPCPVAHSSQEHLAACNRDYDEIYGDDWGKKSVLVYSTKQRSVFIRDACETLYNDVDKASDFFDQPLCNDAGSFLDHCNEDFSGEDALTDSQKRSLQRQAFKSLVNFVDNGMINLCTLEQITACGDSVVTILSRRVANSLDGKMEDGAVASKRQQGDGPVRRRVFDSIMTMLGF